MITSLSNNPNVSGINGIGPSTNESSNSAGINTNQLEELLALIIAMMLQKQSAQGQGQGQGDQQGGNQPLGSNGIGKGAEDAGQQPSAAQQGNGNDILQLLMQIIMQLAQNGSGGLNNSSSNDNAFAAAS